jgi:hypothetical protein
VIFAIRMWLDVVLPFWRIAAALAVVVALAGAVWWVRDSGVQAERERWQVKMIKSEAHWQAQLDAANVANRANERRSAQAIADVSTYYQREIKNVDAQKNVDRGSVQRGSLRLFDRVDPSSSTRHNDCRPLPAAGDATAPAVGRDGGEAWELSRAAVTNLFDLVNDADAVVAQLSAAQSVIAEYQKLCGGGALGGP